MPKNYSDFVDAMTDARLNDRTVDHLILTEESMNSFMTDGNFTEATEEKHDNLGEFTVPIEQGDDNYIVTDCGHKFYL